MRSARAITGPGMSASCENVLRNAIVLNDGVDTLTADDVAAGDRIPGGDRLTERRFCSRANGTNGVNGNIGHANGHVPMRHDVVNGYSEPAHRKSVAMLDDLDGDAETNRLLKVHGRLDAGRSGARVHRDDDSPVQWVDSPCCTDPGCESHRRSTASATPGTGRQANSSPGQGSWATRMCI